MENMIDPLSSLDTFRTTWRIKVRVTRMWPSLSSSDAGEPLKGYNLILLDEDVSILPLYSYSEHSLFLQEYDVL